MIPLTKSVWGPSSSAASCVTVVAAVLWGAFGASSPRTCRYIGAAERRHLEANCVAATGLVPASTFAGILAKLWAGLLPLLAAPSAMAIVLAQVASNWHYAALVNYAPRLYGDRFQLSPAQVGAMLATIQAMGLLAPFFGSWVETTMIKRGARTTTVRRLCAAVGFAATGGCFLVMAATQDYRVAVVAHGLTAFADAMHNAGFRASVFEVGGANSGLLSALSNQFANLAGVGCPMAVVWLREVADGWFWPFAHVAAVCALSAAVYVSNVGTQPIGVPREAKPAERKKER